MLQALTQDDHALTVQGLLHRCETMNSTSECISAMADEPLRRASFGTLAANGHLVAHALRHIGVEPGDRVATLMWNRQEHVELYLGVPSYGAVLHTLNLRLFPEQLAWIVNHAQDRVVFVDSSLVELAVAIAPSCPSVHTWVIVGGEAVDELPGRVITYGALLAAQPDEPYPWPALDDRTAATLCYTSGTTGDPKGVLSSHRSIVIHALATAAVDTIGLSHGDRILVVVPMFHANAWGLPFGAALLGADLVLPGRDLSPQRLCELVEEHRVTIAQGVPTIWYEILRYADAHAPDLSSLRMAMSGGSAVPIDLMRSLEERHDVPVVQAWGMTETGPLGTIARPPRGLSEAEHWNLRHLAGRIVPLMEARLVAEDGTVLPWDGKTTGEIEVRGPWVASAYFGVEADDRFHDGWLRTGDIASIAEGGWVRITDRAKDVIKSGGEWISSVDLENELIAHPMVRACAVIARPDERWGERPVACVVMDDPDCDTRELAPWLDGRVAKWWIPDAWIVVDALPMTGTGKLDKKELRRLLAEGKLPAAEETARVTGHP
jgi:fatty-acyl-CoA synthase